MKTTITAKRTAKAAGKSISGGRLWHIKEGTKTVATVVASLTGLFMYAELDADLSRFVSMPYTTLEAALEAAGVR